MSDDIWLFSYGTLRQPEVQRAVFGRELISCEDVLSGFEVGTIRIFDPSVIEISGSDQHPIVQESTTDSFVLGSALRLNPADVVAADRYESANYVKRSVILKSGRTAFVYVARPNRQIAHPNRIDKVSFVDPDKPMLLRLLPVARHIFTETFASYYDRAAFEAHCDDTYAGDGAMAREFERRDVRWRVAAFEDQPIGYAKLTSVRAPAPKAVSGALELQQIYVLPEWHGTGVADQLMDWALNTARAMGAPELYLTVFDHNERAKRFYKRFGFEEIGRCTFRLGNRIYDDRIWRRILTDTT